jgi:multiple sugar transport system permease protein
LSLPVGVIAVVILSLLLHVRSSRAADATRTVYFVPGAVTGPALVLLAIFMFDPTVSPFAPILQAFGFTSLLDVIRPARLVVLFTIISFFAHTGGWVAIFYGALNGISKEVLEAARMDGCNDWQIAMRIKLPLILPYVWYMLILSFAGNVQLFAEPQLLGATLPGVISSTWSLNQLGYEFAFKLGNFGASAAISLVLLLSGLLAAYLVINFTDFYSTEAD